jgi:hypothetical protein
MSAQDSIGSAGTQAPIDVDLMRASAARLLDKDAELPSAAELETLTLLLRGHIMLVIPEVEEAAAKLPEGDIPRACALACVGEARMRLRMEAGGNLPQQVAHVQRLARSVRSLADHCVNLGGTS